MEHAFYKLFSGADVFNSLNELHFNSNSTSFLISVVGDLSKVAIKCPLNQKPRTIEKKLEIITLTGYLTSKDSHLHISVSDENCSVYGGHLLPGSIVLNSLDILIGEVPNIKQKTIPILNNPPAIVDIYVLKDCSWSIKAIQILDSYHIKYNCYLIENDHDFIQIRDRTSINTFPQILIKGEFIGGYSELSELSKNGELTKLIS